ncbi:ribosome biogenesis factor YjgA [Amphritea sp. 1_MG-2023]|uniref:ribosome biogenesis factor YjgA n=1 Tax=Amphritea sp. 1_MG-2023 TaxID=3062670 RepID=UPI0026E2BE4E|nr:ribosome biogenesis factor YjgA [Amphritea sp. 1_MG-2023]MDO6564071.1 ribosome biogenesis factor YjgA [Amphritea sp. 1_MG-2023]
MSQHDDFLPDDEHEFDEEWVSKSQRKREMEQLQELGTKLPELNKEQLAKVPMSDTLRSAIEEAQRLQPRSEATRRQLQYIGRLMRGEDADEIQAAVDQFEAGKQAHLQVFHKLERWRDRLILGDNTDLQAYLSEDTGADIQHLRQLLRNAKKEASLGKPPVAAKKLFKYLRERAEV